MRKWDVYIDKVYVGTVEAPDIFKATSEADKKYRRTPRDNVRVLART